jgi:transposase
MRGARAGSLTVSYKIMGHELDTHITALLPPICAVRLTKVIIEKTSVELQLTATAPTAACPRCAMPSSSIHSGYQRHPTDLPWGMHPVRIQLRVRKFVCRNTTCTRRIFTERLPDLVATYARKTHRLITALRAIGMAIGGQAGARLATRLRVPASAATLLRLIREAPIPPTPTLQAVGVDEWAWRRGHRYGTILVNLANHRVVDLLPDRSAASVAAWLAQHPTIAVVSRDRSDLYADGIRRGAPQAVQVVDRFHLVQNLREAVEAFLVTQRPVLQVAADRTAQALTASAAPVPVMPMYGGKRQCSHTRQQQRAVEQQRRHTPWVACYETIHARYAQGTGITTIARQLGISRPTVYAYLRRATPPAPRSPQRSGQVLRPYLPYLIRRWREGITDSRHLWREIEAQGDAHSARTVYRFVTRLRRATEAGQAPETQTSPYTRPQGPSARAVSLTWVCPDAKRSPGAQTYVDQLTQADPSIAQAYRLSQTFLVMVREHRGHDLEAWIMAATDSGIDALARFARGLQEDLAAVTAGLTLDWNNGPVEGQITRLKLLKRQGYGRAGFPLLRQRVMQAA